MGRTLVLVAFALVAWGLCGATIGVARGLMPMETALVVHAVAAPIIAGVLAYLYARYFAGPRPLVIGAVFLGVVLISLAVAAHCVFFADAYGRRRARTVFLSAAVAWVAALFCFLIDFFLFS